MLLDKLRDSATAVKTVISLMVVAVAFNAYFAKAADLGALITSLEIQSKQERIWTLEDRYPVDVPQSVKEELRKLKTELEALKKK